MKIFVLVKKKWKEINNIKYIKIYILDMFSFVRTLLGFKK